MRRLLNLLGIKQGKYSVMIKDTHQGTLPPTELKQPAYKPRRISRIVNADLDHDLRLTTLLSDYIK